MRRITSVFVASAVLAGLVGFPAFADVKVPPIFSDNMVLQRQVEIPVWGTATPGEEVTVALETETVTTKADRSGKWLVHLKPREAGGNYTLIIRGNNILSFTRVMVGEVWVCSGQSNMEWPLKLANNAEAEIAAANDKALRGIVIKKAISSKPTSEMSGSWALCTPEVAGDFSAVAYFFAKHLRETLNVPVGLIMTYWGGTPAEAWTEASFLQSDPDFEPLLKRWNENLGKVQANLDEFEKSFKVWKNESIKAENEGRPVGDPPKMPEDPRRSPHRPTGLYNAMISPLLPYAMRGAIWYQGESNAGRAYQYRKLFPAMINSWRKAWGQGDFPFLFVQLANFTPTFPEPRESAWAELREAQTMTLSLPNTGMAVIIDIGEAGDIHPRNKQDVGKRLGLQAEKIVYGREVAASGPMYESMQIEEGKIRIKFKHADNGLSAKDGDLKGFAIAGEDHKFVWANAVIEGDSVVVSAEGVAKPVEVRYAWDDNPVCNLYNGAGLPACPFRTDDWPGKTINEK